VFDILRRSLDGLTLYAVSSDGTMGVFHFDPEEMEGLCPLSAQKDYLKKFGYEPPPLRVGFSHQGSPAVVPEIKVDVPARANSVGQPSNGVNTLIAKRNTKKRVPLVGATPAPTQSSKIQPSPTAASRHNPPSISAGITSYSFDDPTDSGRMQLDQLISASSSRSPTVSSWNRNARYPSDHFPGNEDVEMLDAHSDMSVQISSLNDDETFSTRGKRKISDLIDDGRPVKARTLGGDQGRRERPVVREIASGSNVGQNFAQSSNSVLLPTPPLLNFLTAKVDGAQDVLECLNKVDEGEECWNITHPSPLTIIQGLHELTFRTGAMQQTQWLDFLPSPVIGVTVTKKFCAAAMQDGCINVYTPTGRRYGLRGPSNASINFL
jgi:protein HIRA/HIR1